FEVDVKDKRISASGAFSIIPYEIELQSQSAAWSKLSRTAKISNGDLDILDNRAVLLKKLIEDDRYTPVQKAVNKTVSLIEFEFLLFVIVACLAIEWFLRKYNGLI
ncbi:MAG: VWA domain-containing protein, partial [Leeuwenhoekiella sp.]